MCVIVGRSSESSHPSSAVRRSSICSYSTRAPEHAGPARMGAPGLEGRRDRRDDVRLEVEAEVVARREIGEPLLADADHAAVDLVDDCVHHRVGRAQVSETATRFQPAFEPGETRRFHRGDNRHISRGALASVATIYRCWVRAAASAVGIRDAVSDRERVARHGQGEVACAREANGRHSLPAADDARR